MPISLSLSIYVCVHSTIKQYSIMIMAINHKRISSDIIDREAMANCHQLLSRRQQQQHNSSSSSGASAATTSATTTAPLSSFDRLFTCKTCRRSFTSFQALGGHSASHNHERAPRGSASSKSRTHQCSICGLQFPMGQALGGHMRKHRSSSYHHHPKEAAAAAVGSKRPRSPYPFPPTTPPPTPPLRPEPAERDHVEFMKRFKFDDGSRKDLSMSFEMDSSGLARTVLDRAKSLYIHEEEEDDDLLQLRLGPPVIRTC